jgi:hypothetical protein
VVPPAGRFDSDDQARLLDLSSGSTGTMPTLLDTPVLQVNSNAMHMVDTTNPQILFNMWTGQSFPLYDHINVTMTNF